MSWDDGDWPERGVSDLTPAELAALVVIVLLLVGVLVLVAGGTG